MNSSLVKSFASFCPKYTNFSYKMINPDITLIQCYSFTDYIIFLSHIFLCSDRRGRARMVVGFITTCVISAYHHLRCEYEPRSWRDVLDTTLCDKVLSVTCNRSVGFLRVLHFPAPIKLTAMI